MQLIARIACLFEFLLFFSRFPIMEKGRKAQLCTMRLKAPLVLFHPYDLPLDQLISIQTVFLKPIYASSGREKKRQSVRCVCVTGGLD